MNKPLLGMTIACGFAVIAGYRSWNPEPQRLAESTPEVIHKELEFTPNIQPAPLPQAGALQAPAKTKNQLRAEQAQARREKLLSRELERHGMSYDAYPFTYVYLDLVNGDVTQTANLIVDATRALTDNGLEWPQPNLLDLDDYQYNESLRQAEMRILHKVTSSPEAAVAQMNEAIYHAEAKYAARVWATHMQATVDENNRPDILVYEEALKTVPERYIKSFISEAIRQDSSPALSSITYNVALTEPDHIKYPMLVALLTLPHTDAVIREAVESHLHTKFGLDLSDKDEIAMMDWDHFFETH